MLNNHLNGRQKVHVQGVITANGPVEPSATGIKMKSSDQDIIESIY